MRELICTRRDLAQVDAGQNIRWHPYDIPDVCLDVLYLVGELQHLRQGLGVRDDLRGPVSPRSGWFRVVPHPPSAQIDIGQLDGAEGSAYLQQLERLRSLSGHVASGFDGDVAGGLPYRQQL